GTLRVEKGKPYITGFIVGLVAAPIIAFSAGWVSTTGARAQAVENARIDTLAGICSDMVQKSLASQSKDLATIKGWDNRAARHDPDHTHDRSRVDRSRRRGRGLAEHISWPSVRGSGNSGCPLAQDGQCLGKIRHSPGGQTAGRQRPRTLFYSAHRRQRDDRN